MLTLAELQAMAPGDEVVDRAGTSWTLERFTRRWKYEGMARGWSSEMLLKKWGPLRRRKETHVEQPMPTASAGPSMHALASRVLKERASIGLDRYGQELQVLNGRDAVRDTIEELADGLAYALQIREERRLLREELTALAESVAGGEVDERLRRIIDRYFPS